MARINVEDSIYRDPRFVQLCAKVGGMATALGTLVMAWDAAQRAFWKHSKTVPIEELRNKIEHLEQLVQVGLARIENGTEVYIAGSEEAFRSLEAKREKRRLAGQKSGEVRRKKAERTKPNKREHNGTKRTNTNPSTSTSTSIIPFPTETGEVATLPPGERNPVGLWIKAYRDKYGVRYAVDGKDGRMLISSGKAHGLDRLELLIACYLAIEDKLYSAQKHPLSLFFRDLQKINVAAQTGIDPSKPERFDVSKLKD
jgi:hypothetical protein